MNKKHEIRIRNIDNKIYSKLERIVEKYNYPSINQFLLSKLFEIVENESLNTLNNDLADEIYAIKKLQHETNERLFNLQVVQYKLENRVYYYSECILLLVDTCAKTKLT